MTGLFSYSGSVPRSYRYRFCSDQVESEDFETTKKFSKHAISESLICNMTCLQRDHHRNRFGATLEPVPEWPQLVGTDLIKSGVVRSAILF